MLKKIFLSFILIFSFSYLFAENISNNIKVTDGDTIVINKEKIRFVGIDTPELKQTCTKDDKKIFCGEIAKSLLIKKIGNEIPKCISEGKDRYNRVLAECFVNGESLSSFLVRSGYAFAYRKYSKKFVKDEDYAKTNNLGMWNMQFQYPWDWRKKNKFKK